MAKFYLDGVPKTPGIGPGSQGAQVPERPYRATGWKTDLPSPEFGRINAQVQNIDIAKNIPSLMQKELPANLSDALVKGPQRTGAAWAGAAESLANFAETTGLIAGRLAQSKDLADKSRYKNLIQLSDAAFNEEVATKNLTGMEAMELSQSYHDKLDSDIGALGLSRDNIDQAGVDLQLYKSKHRTELTNGMREEQIKSDTAAIEARMTQAVNAGDIEGAIDALEDAKDAQLINDGQYAKKKQELYIAFDEYKAQTDIGSNPREALQLLDQIVTTGENHAYSNLTAGQIRELRNQAAAEVDRRERETTETILNGIADGSLKTPENIEDAAGGNLGANDVNKLKAAQAMPGPAYSPEAYSKIETAIDGYVKEPLDSGSPKYFEILGMIQQGAPKSEWSDLVDRLQKKRDKQKDTLPGKDWFPELLNEFTNMTEDGRFIPKKDRWAIDPRAPAAAFTLENMKDPEWRLQHKAELDAMWDRSRSMQILMRKWRQEHPGDDEQTIKDARKYQNELLQLDSSNAGRAAIQEQLQIQLPEPPVRIDRMGPTSSIDGTSRISPSLITEREEIMSELDRDPSTKRLAMQMLDTEGGGVATMEALVNRVAMIRQRVPDWTIWDELNSGFYGPIKRGHAQTLKLHPDTIARYQRDIDVVRSGSNVVKGRTDQGYPGDPNWRGPGRVHVADNPKEVYNYWTGKRRGIQFSHADAARFAASYG